MQSEPKLSRLFTSIPTVLVLIVAFNSVFAQSTEQLSPTPITTNQLSGQIRARDIGDSRVTTYYYVFDGNRGDIFINVVTNNFNGDIDVFTVDGLKPRTKITVYADSSENETGRVIYMRQPEKLLLRIQGRPPNDDPATFQIKFAGSFGALASTSSVETVMPTVDRTGEGTVRVNSVGTIIEDPEEPKRADELKVDEKNDASANTSRNSDVPATFDPRKKPETLLEEAVEKSRPRVIVDDPYANTGEERKELTVQIREKPKSSAVVTIERVPEETPEDPVDPKTEAEKKAAALAKINLVILLKNGDKFKKRMSKVSSFNVFDGVLKVVAIDGEVTKFSILEVVKITIE